MTEEIRVKAVRTFEGEEGFKTPASEPFTVRSRQRLADLKANGLVIEHGDSATDDGEQKATGGEGEGEKAAPTPSNKKAPDPKNKAA